MTSDIFQAFAKHASGGPDTPNDYLATKLAMMKMFPKLAGSWMNAARQIHPIEMGAEAGGAAWLGARMGGRDLVRKGQKENDPKQVRQGVSFHRNATKIGVGSGIAAGIGHHLLTKHANDQYANDLARRAAQAGKLRPVTRLLTKLGMGLDSHALLAQSLYHNNSPNTVAHMAIANPAHRSGLLGGIKNIAPAVGGVRTMGSNPLRAVASGVLHSKLASGFIHPAVDLAGLGMMGVPVAKTLRDPKATAKEKSHARWEGAGLATLGGVSAHNIWQAAKKPAAAALTHV